MAFSIKYILKYNRIDPPLRAPIYLRIIYRSQYFHKSMRREVDLKKWDEAKERLKSSAENSIKMNLYLDKIKRRIEDKMLSLDAKDSVIPPRLIKELLKENHSGTSFINFFEKQLEILESTGRIGTYKKDRVVFRKLKKFTKGRDLSFIEINQDFLEEFEVFLRKKCKNNQNTVHNNIRVLRKLFYLGVDRGYEVESQDIFKKYKLRKGEPKEIVFLTEDELNRMWNLDLSNQKKIVEISRDMFVFASDVGGMRISDVMLLKHSNLINGRVVFTSRKTNITCSIKINQRPQEIINKYMKKKSKKDRYVFPVLAGTDLNDNFKKHNIINSRTAMINRYLKMVKVLACINKNLSFHVSRHTFAMRAIEKGISIKYISSLMGHSNILMTEKYLDIQNSCLDEAMNVFN